MCHRGSHPEEPVAPTAGELACLDALKGADERLSSDEFEPQTQLCAPVAQGQYTQLRLKVPLNTPARVRFETASEPIERFERIGKVRKR